MNISLRFRAVGEEISKYKLDLVGVQGVEDIGGKPRRKESTGKTKTQLGGQY
jgi:hypothetical protein